MTCVTIDYRQQYCPSPRQSLWHVRLCSFLHVSIHFSRNTAATHRLHARRWRRERPIDGRTTPSEEVTFHVFVGCPSFRVGTPRMRASNRLRPAIACAICSHRSDTCKPVAPTDGALLSTKRTRSIINLLVSPTTPSVRTRQAPVLPAQVGRQLSISSE